MWVFEKVFFRDANDEEMIGDDGGIREDKPITVVVVVVCDGGGGGCGCV